MAEILLPLGRLLVALLLVVLNGFFVGAEFAFVRIRPTAVEELVAEGRAGAETLADVMANLDDYLAVTQLGITLASLGLGWAGEPAVAALIEPLLAPLLSERVLHLVAFAIGFGLITFLHVVFGELAPKTVAIQEAERLSLFVAPPMKLFYYVFLPGIVVFNGAANAVTRAVGVAPAAESEETLPEKELRRVLAQSGREGHVAAEEVEMIESVFELDDTSVREVMIPRPDVAAVTEGTTLTELRELVFETGHTRYPVVEGADGDRIVGFVDVKDVLEATGGAAAETEPTAGDMAREVLVVPETIRLDELLLEFRDSELQMAAVIDEWGAFEGIATVEDVLEAIVGDLRDDFDAAPEPGVRRREPGTYVVDAGVPVAELNDALDADFDAAGYETVGGLVLDNLQRAATVGDSVTVDGRRLEVTAVDGTRISTVVVTEGADGDGPEEAGDGTVAADDGVGAADPDGSGE